MTDIILYTSSLVSVVTVCIVAMIFVSRASYRNVMRVVYKCGTCKNDVDSNTSFCGQCGACFQVSTNSTTSTSFATQNMHMHNVANVA